MLYLFLLFIYADAISGNDRDLSFKLLTVDTALLSDRGVTLFEDAFVMREGPTALMILPPLPLAVAIMQR